MPEMTTAGALEVINAVRAVSTVARCVSVEDLEAFLRQADYEDAFMPFFDPTAWIRHRDQMKLWRDAATALLTFRREVERLALEHDR